MIVKSAELEGFRNYGKCRFEFDEGINVITGRNAQGKTNLLEALFYLCCGRSFRTRSDRELICHERDEASVTADIFSDGRDQRLEAYLSKLRRKRLIANGVKLKTSAELAGRLTCVLFSPDDLTMIRDGASVRRRVMDDCLCQLRPRYAAALSEFSRLYEHKLRILKDHRDDKAMLSTLDDFNDRMCAQSAVLIYYRSAFVKNLNRKASEIHFRFSGESERLELKYKTVSTIPDPTGLKPSELLPLLKEHQESHRRAELEAGMCLSGAHKDDMEIFINGSPARSFASQGQARTAALSVKLAERDIHFEDRGEYPILLLDDVLSELDSVRQSFVLNRITDGQVFVTCCEDDNISARTGGRVITVSGGRILEN